MKQHNGTPELTQKPAWNAVYALSLGVAGLITSEFLPVSLLTPMAKDLHITEGIAGQSISITAVVAMVASLLIAIVTKRMDRRHVLLSFSVLQILSNVLVAFAPNFLILTIGAITVGYSHRRVLGYVSIDSHAASSGETGSKSPFHHFWCGLHCNGY